MVPLRAGASRGPGAGPAPRRRPGGRCCLGIDFAPRAVESVTRPISPSASAEAPPPGIRRRAEHSAAGTPSSPTTGSPAFADSEEARPRRVGGSRQSTSGRLSLEWRFRGQRAGDGRGGGVADAEDGARDSAGGHCSRCAYASAARAKPPLPGAGREALGRRGRGWADGRVAGGGGGRCQWRPGAPRC